MSVFGTEGSFEEAVGSQRFLTKELAAEDWLDVSDLPHGAGACRRR